MGWLHDHFYSCTDVVDETELRQYTCTYMLSIIGGFMLPDRSSTYVHCQYLLAFRERRPFAWGATVLSWMYLELGRVTFKIEGGPTSTSAGDIGGWMVLLQAWCLERFPNIARRMHERGLRRPQSQVPPLIARWKDWFHDRRRPTSISQFRQLFDEGTRFQWIPYIGDEYSDIPEREYRAITPLIYFWSIMWHRPDRVLRQLRM
ncbi:Serine/threonine-protein phosphatase 7 long form homolog [Linum grandiflorum]